MRLDTERQREILLAMFRDMTFPGANLEELYDLKRSIAFASLGPHGPAEAQDH